MSCEHYEGNAQQGECGLGLYGGTVRPATICSNYCPVRSKEAGEVAPPAMVGLVVSARPKAEPAKPGLGAAVRGALGLAKEAAGIDAVPDEVRDERWSICVACPESVAGKCGRCGCNLPAKIRLAGHSCPVGRW